MFFELYCYYGWTLLAYCRIKRETLKTDTSNIQLSTDRRRFSVLASDYSVDCCNLIACASGFLGVTKPPPFDPKQHTLPSFFCISTTLEYTMEVLKGGKRAKALKQPAPWLFVPVLENSTNCISAPRLQPLHRALRTARN